MGRLSRLRTAVAFLTVLPAPVEDDPDPGWLSSAALIGLTLGAVSGGLLAALRGLSADPYQQLLSSALLVAFLALVTRGLHLDGLADTADGLGASGRGPEAGLAAMRDPHVGAFGLVSVVLVVLVQVAALWQAVIQERGTVAIVTAVATGRLALLWGAREGVRAARSDGLGAGVIGRVRPTVVVLSSLAVLVVCAAAGAVDDHRGARGAAHVAVALVVGLAAAIGVRRRAERRFGGVTGDVLGAMVEVATAAALVVMAYDINGG